MADGEALSTTESTVRMAPQPVLFVSKTVTTTESTDYFANYKDKWGVDHVKTIEAEAGYLVFFKVDGDDVYVCFNDETNDAITSQELIADGTERISIPFFVRRLRLKAASSSATVTFYIRRA